MLLRNWKVLAMVEGTVSMRNFLYACMTFTQPKTIMATVLKCIVGLCKEEFYLIRTARLQKLLLLQHLSSAIFVNLKEKHEHDKTLPLGKRSLPIHTLSLIFFT